MNQVAARRIGRPPRISRRQILDAAAAFDPRELQLTTLADQLGISVKTVYYYFPNRKAVLDALTERAVALLGAPDLAACRTPRDVLSAIGHWAYGLAQKHPLWYFDTAPPMALGVRELSNYLDLMSTLGVDDRAALTAFEVVGNYAFAAGAAAHRTRAVGGLGKENVERLVRELGDEAAAARISAVIGDVDLVEWFERSLSVVLAGIEQELLARPPAPPRALD